jgi:hypothetical protein
VRGGRFVILIFSEKESVMVEVQMRNLGTLSGGYSGNTIIYQNNIISTAFGGLRVDRWPR